MFVMDDKTGDAARKSVGELPDHGAAGLVQHIDAAVQMDHGPVPVRGHEPQQVLKLRWRVGIYLGGHAHLGETEPSQLEQRIVPRDPALEQGTNRQAPPGRPHPAHQDPDQMGGHDP